MKLLSRAIGLAACVALLSVGTALAVPIAGDGIAGPGLTDQHITAPDFTLQCTDQANMEFAIACIAEPEVVSLAAFIPDAVPVRPLLTVLGVDHGIASPLPLLIPK